MDTLYVKKRIAKLRRDLAKRSQYGSSTKTTKALISELEKMLEESIEEVYEERKLIESGFSKLKEWSEVFDILSSGNFDIKLAKKIDYDFDDYETPITITNFSQIPCKERKKDYQIYIKDSEKERSLRGFSRRFDSIKIKGYEAYVELKTVKNLINSFDLDKFDNDDVIFSITKKQAKKINELLS